MNVELDINRLLANFLDMSQQVDEDYWILTGTDPAVEAIDGEGE
jgi:hypothetical protein